jgi:hypothetical protein
MVRWAEEGPAQPASRHVLKISLDWFGFGNVDSIEVGLSQAERIALEKFSIQREGAIVVQAIKRRFRFSDEPNFVAFRLFKK